MLACVSPTAASSSMTESTLRFATDARKVRTLPVLNEERAGEFALSLRREIEQLGKQLGRASAADRRRLSGVGSGDRAGGRSGGWPVRRRLCEG